MPLHERFEGLHGVEEISGFLDKQFSNVYMDRKYKERNQKLRRLLEDSNRRLYTFKMVQNIRYIGSLSGAKYPIFVTGQVGNEP